MGTAALCAERTGFHKERISYSFLIKIFDFYQEGAAVSVALLRQSAAKAVS